MRRAILLLVLSSAACSTDATLGLRRYQLTGVVVGREAPPRIVVEHDAVNGFMPAMRMAFEIGDPAAPPLNMGDRIAATLVLSDTRSWLEDVKVTARAGAPATRPPEARAVPGTVVPDLPLVDQNGEPFTLRDAGGRVRIVTFIYTRCPLPDFCPLMVRHLEAVRRRANEEGLGSRLALLGVTLDPAFDTPAVSARLRRIDAEGARPIRPVDASDGNAGANRSRHPVLRRRIPRRSRVRHAYADDGRRWPRWACDAGIRVQLVASGRCL